MLEAFRERQSEVGAAAVELAELAARIGARGLSERVRRDLAEKLAEDRFHLVVVGEFNHGKSSFVNALLGRAALPVGVTPTTAAIHHLVYAEQPRAEVVLESGEREALAFEEVPSFSVGGRRDGAAVRYVEVGLPAELLKERVVLVDTPGVNDLSLTRAEVTYGYVPRADAVLFVIDAGQPVKESERQFLEQQLIGRSRDKIVFVVAKADLWTEAERAEALPWIEKKLAELVPSPRVFPVSAHAALAGRVAESGLPELLAHLTRFLAEERGRIVLGNVLTEAKGAAGVLARGLDARRRVATVPSIDLASRIELLERDLAGRAGAIEDRRFQIREAVGSIKAWARRDLERFVDDLLARLPAQFEQASGDDLRLHLAPFLENAFREWAEAETREIAAALEALAEKTLALVRDDAREVGRRVGEAMGGDLHSPSIEVDTLAYDVSVFATLSLGLITVFANVLLGGVLLAAAPALALWSRGRQEKELKRRALLAAPAALREAAARVAPRIDELVDGFGARLDAWVVITGEELHREVIDVLRAVRDARSAASGERDHDAEREVTDAEAWTAELAALRVRLEALAQRVAG